MIKFSKYLFIDLDCRELVDEQADARQPLSLAELEILKLLSHNIGEVVSKEELVEAGWPGRVVAPSSLTQCISHLRRKIESHHDIELKTIPRYGYSLCSIEHGQAQSVEQPSSVGNGHLVSDKESVPLSPNHIGQPSVKVNANVGSQVTEANKKPWWRHNITLFVTLFLVLGSLHVLGVLKKSVNYLSLLSQPSIESIKSDEDSLANKRVEYSQVRLEGQPEVVRHLAHFVGSWSNTQKLVNGSSLKKIYANNNKRYESVAMCNEFSGGCGDTQPLNLVRDTNTFSPLDLDWLANTKLRMEQVTYNKILLDKFANPAEGLTEDIYRADVYYYGPSHNVVRADVRLSLVFEGADRGKLYAAACITDDLLREVSIRYQFSGEFKMKQSKVDGQTIRSFLVNAEDRSFTSPQEISKESATIYREIRKNVLTEEDMILRQIYSDDHSGVWMLPLWGDTLVWAHRVEVKL